jgi:hypothetical protein
MYSVFTCGNNKKKGEATFDNDKARDEGGDVTW